MNKASNQRVSLSVYFMLLGFLFASWASRIPSIKSNFNFDEAQLGSLLLVMPISSLIGLPISGWLVSKFNSRIPLLISFIILSLSLPIIGFATNVQQLVVGVALFSFCTRIANIAVNTQSITLQKQREKKIIGSFHGLWSLGGLAGALFSTFMVRAGVSMEDHFVYVVVFSLTLGLLSYPFLIASDKSSIGNKLILGKPDK